MATFTFFSASPGKTYDLDNGNEHTDQMLVAISSRLPQTQIRQEIKSKTEPSYELHLDASSSQGLPITFGPAWTKDCFFHLHKEIYEIPVLDKTDL